MEKEKEPPAYIEFELHLNCGGTVSNFEKLNELLKKFVKHTKENANFTLRLSDKFFNLQ